MSRLTPKAENIQKRINIAQDTAMITLNDIPSVYQIAPIFLITIVVRSRVYTLKYMNYYFDALKKYADFSGRASRQQYWMFVLFNCIVAAVIWLADFVLHSELLYSLYLLGVIIPAVAIGVRRLHDTDHSGWWYLIVFIPFLGAIVMLVFFCTDSQPGQNRFGPNPKGV
jgi:uncharacterized membrane protein YhaH (DUF805 family)